MRTPILYAIKILFVSTPVVVMYALFPDPWGYIAGVLSATFLLFAYGVTKTPRDHGDGSRQYFWSELLTVAGMFAAILAIDFVLFSTVGRSQ